MPDQLYNIKVKNTFLEVDADDDILNDLSLDDDEFRQRQVTEPVPATNRLLDIQMPLDIPKTKLFVESSTLHNTDYLDKSSTSSEHDPKVTEPFQPECEPELTYDGSEMPRQMTEELYWNDWSDEQRELDMEQSCMSPYLSHALSGQFAVDPDVYTRTAIAPFGHEGSPGNLSGDRCTSQQKGEDPAPNKTKTQRRRKRESLIDVAARTQKQESRKTKQHEKQLLQEQLGLQPASSTVQGKQGRSVVSKAKLPACCPQCGGKVQTGYNFCRFCGVAIAFFHDNR
jgi:hypothetical protein